MTHRSEQTSYPADKGTRTPHNQNDAAPCLLHLAVRVVSPDTHIPYYRERPHKAPMLQLGYTIPYRRHL